MLDLEFERGNNLVSHPVLDELTELKVMKNNYSLFGRCVNNGI
jgi:hypothetical protein